MQIVESGEVDEFEGCIIKTITKTTRHILPSEPLIHKGVYIDR